MTFYNYNYSSTLAEMKINLCKRLANLLRRQTSISHLIQAARLILSNSDVISQMLQDWKSLNKDQLIRETLHLLQGLSPPHSDIIRAGK